MQNLIQSTLAAMQRPQPQYGQIKIQGTQPVSLYGDTLRAKSKAYTAQSLATLKRAETRQLNGKVKSNVVSTTINDYVAGIESKGSYTAQNPNSTAYGKYQHLDATRSALAKRLGVTVDYLKTPQGQEMAQSALVTEQKSQLSGLGLPATNDNMLAIHQMGYPDFKKFKAGTLNSADVAKVSHLYSYQNR